MNATLPVTVGSGRPARNATRRGWMPSLFATITTDVLAKPGQRLAHARRTGPECEARDDKAAVAEGERALRTG